VTRILVQENECAVCGKMIEVRSISSYSSYGYSGLDGKPPTSAWSVIKSHSVKCCPICGYCAYDINRILDKQRNFVQSAEYQDQIKDTSLSDDAKRFYCAGLIAEKFVGSIKAANLFIKAAWCCDDEEQTGQAVMLRKLAIDQLLLNRLRLPHPTEMNIEMGICMNNDNFMLLLIDLYRRIGRFETASLLAKRHSNEDITADLKQILLFEQKLCDERDISEYNVGQALGLEQVKQDKDNNIDISNMLEAININPEEREKRQQAILERMRQKRESRTT